MEQIQSGPLKGYFFPDDKYFLPGNFKQQQTDATIAHIKPGDVCVDIGANYGYYTLLMSNCVGPKGKVYAFEPVEETFDDLELTIKCNGIKNVKPLCMAVSNTIGVARIKNCGAGDLDACLEDGIYMPDEYGWKLPVKYNKVAVITIDKFFLQRTDKINFIKIDTQGLDILVLQGGTKAIERFKPVIICESLGKENHEKITAFFNSVNYSCQTVEPGYMAGKYFVEHLICKPI